MTAAVVAAQVIVATNMGLAASVKINQSCRQQGTAFVRAELHGVFGSVFCDFGNAFTVLDVDGVCMPLCPIPLG
jgi:ubiquitin-activating enzyme E1